MADLSENELQTGPITFMGTAYTHDLSGAKASVWVCHSTAEFALSGPDLDRAPAAVRGQTILVRRYSPELADLSQSGAAGTARTVDDWPSDMLCRHYTSGVVHLPAVRVISAALSAIAGRAAVPRANQTGVMETSREPELTGSKRTSSSPEY